MAGIALNPLRTRVAQYRIGLVCFPTVMAVYAAHLFSSSFATFSYDSQTYWLLGKTFKRNGQFSLVSYHEQYHGYSVPLLYHFVSVVGSYAGLSATSVIKQKLSDAEFKQTQLDAKLQPDWFQQTGLEIIKDDGK